MIFPNTSIIPRGMTDRTIRVLLNVLNSRIRIENIPKIAMIIAVPMPPKLSCLLSISPAGYDFISFRQSAAYLPFARICFVTLSVLYPVFTEEDIVIDLSLL